MSDTYWAMRFNRTKLREVREGRDLSKTELARRIGVDRQAVRHYEDGKKTPRFGTLYKLTQVLEVDIVELLHPGPEDLPVLRLRVGLLQKAVAAAMGFSTSKYQNIEAKTGTITRAELRKLAGILRVTQRAIKPYVIVS